VIYSIPRYPVHLIDVAVLRDGRRITIRPTLPQDLELQRAFFRSLSRANRYARFMTGLTELPETVARRFASIDYCEHLALLAEVFETSGERMLGEARYVVEPYEPTSCVFAIAVADDWHGTGLAGMLLERLEQQAAASGIRRMTADTLSGNGPMLGLAARAGYASMLSHRDDGVVHLEKRLFAPTANCDQVAAA
jgi:GNAT superfamily N-acetyltransferase